MRKNEDGQKTISKWISDTNDKILSQNSEGDNKGKYIMCALFGFMWWEWLGIAALLIILIIVIMHLIETAITSGFPNELYVEQTNGMDLYAQLPNCYFESDVCGCAQYYIDNPDATNCSLGDADPDYVPATDDNTGDVPGYLTYAILPAVEIDTPSGSSEVA